MNGIIGGTSLLASSLFAGWKEETVSTPFGDIFIKTRGTSIFVQRHGNPPMPPHMINFRANIWALKSRNAQKVLSINSVGSLKTEIKPGTFVVPSDFISPWVVPTFFDKEMRFIVPEMDTAVRRYVLALCKKLGLNVRDGGVYIQTIGPRLETSAEIRMLKRFGDIVGMTMASEATLCMECELPYTSLCSVDNYCHGIVRVPLTMDEINRNCQRNMKAIGGFIQSVIERDFT